MEPLGANIEAGALCVAADVEKLGPPNTLLAPKILFVPKTLGCDTRPAKAFEAAGVGVVIEAPDVDCTDGWVTKLDESHCVVLALVGVGAAG